MHAPTEELSQFEERQGLGMSRDLIKSCTWVRFVDGRQLKGKLHGFIGDV